MLAHPPKPSVLPVHRPERTSAVSNVDASASDSGENLIMWHEEFQKRFPALSSDSRIPDTVARYHTHDLGPNQCCSAVVQEIAAPVSTVWPVVRRFDNPQAYKHFVKSCHVIGGDGNVGTLRQVHVVSGLPAASSTERLEILDDERHVISFSVVGGDHRLANYRSVTTLHPSPAGDGTVVVESYVVDVPPGNTKDETCHFVDIIVRCNLQSLAKIAENSAARTTSL